MAAKKVLMLVGDYVEDYEVMVPFQMLLMVGHQVDAVVDGNLVTAEIAPHERAGDPRCHQGEG